MLSVIFYHYYVIIYSVIDKVIVESILWYIGLGGRMVTSKMSKSYRLPEWSGSMMWEISGWDALMFKSRTLRFILRVLSNKYGTNYFYIIFLYIKLLTTYY